MEKLLMLGTSYASREMIEYAKSQGVYTIVTDPRSPEKSTAKLISDEYWMINTADVDTLEAKCRETGITAVCCGISEFNLEMTMELCKRLGLPSYCTPEAWHYSRDKADFKQLCKEVGAPVPEDYYLSDQLTEEELDKVKFPVIVKPVDMCSNRGVSYCYNKSDLIAAYNYAKSISHSDKIIVERMLHGEEWVISYAFADGEVSLMGMSSMIAQPGEPKNIYTISTTVSNHVNQYINDFNPLVEKVLKKVGCREGYGWVQAMYDQNDQFYIIEMGYRMDGEMMFLPFKKLLDFDTIALLVDISRGIRHSKSDLPKPQTQAYTECACGMVIFSNRSGLIKAIEGFDKMNEMPGVIADTMNQPGDEIDKYQILGVITFATENCEEMCALIQKVNDVIHIYDEQDEDVAIKYTDFDYLRRIYQEGLEGK